MSRVINTKNENGDTEIYVLMQGGKPAGFLLIAAKARQLTVIHLVGSIQLAQLEELVNSTVHFQGAE
jgi:hypothetical protein